MKKILAQLFGLLVYLAIPLYISSDLCILNNEYAHGFNSSKNLKVMTYNIRGARTDDGEIKLDTIIREIKKLDPDILALQEVDYHLPRSHFENQVEIIGKKLEMNYLYVPNLNFVIGSYGNAILSKFPIMEYEYFQLPSKSESRGLVRAQINTGIQNIDVYATHLGLPYTERVDQVASLNTLISNGPMPKLLLGDFNTKPTEIPIQSLRSVFIDPVRESHFNLTTYKHKNKATQLDYILYTSGFTFESALSDLSTISDHNPLMYSLILSTP